MSVGGHGEDRRSLGGPRESTGPGWLRTLRHRVREIHPGDPLALLLALLAVQVTSTADFDTALGQTLGAVLVLCLAGTILVFLGLGSALRLGTALLVVAAIFASATRGGDRIHLVAPLIVLAALAALMATRRSAVRAFPLLFGVLGVLLLSIALGGIRLNPRTSGGGGGTPDAGPADASASSLMQRIREFLGLDDSTGTSELEPPPGPGSPPDASPNWWLLLIVVLVVALAAFLLWRFLRRRRGSGAGGLFGPKSDLIHRFERVGASVGREREPSEGLVDYGETLSRSTDDRPREAGATISHALYHPSGGNREAAEDLVADLEVNPPEGPKDSPTG